MIFKKPEINILFKILSYEVITLDLNRENITEGLN